MAHPEFWIDAGGTFTDCMARHPDGRVETCKVLSSGRVKGRAGESSTPGVILDEGRTEPDRFFDGWSIGSAKVRRYVRGRIELDGPVPVGAYELSSGEPAPLLAIRRILGLKLSDPIPPVDVFLGTTRGTNALLERKVGRTLFITTAGFRDVLRIANQNRPKLFDLHIEKPSPLFADVVEIQERVAADGAELQPVDVEKAKRDLARAAKGCDSAAICLLNAYVNGEHEAAVEKIAREAGFRHVSVSSKVVPLIKLVSRGDTTVVDAALTPVLRDYLRTIRRAIPEGRLKIMTSAGGLVDADTFVGKDSILSGPAGGVVGFSHVAREAGFERAIGFDMGGTSTDVSRFDGEFEYQFETEKAGVRIVAPMLAIETVAAGGGSICRYDGTRLVVGPESAGADPGPACYGRGGPLAVTDVNLFLGRILPEFFPFPLDREAVKKRLEEVCEATGRGLEELAEGFRKIANENMAAAIRRISVEKGVDARDYALVSFGSAGAQHACAVARLLGIRTIVLNPHAGVLSALGIGVADVTRFAERAVHRPIEEASRIDIEGMTQECRRQVEAEGVSPERARALFDLRYHGQDHVITCPEATRESFEASHRRLYGHVFEDRPVEILAVRVEVTGVRPKPPTARAAEQERSLSGRPYFRREELRAGDRLAGPVIVVEPTSTIVIDPGWQGRVSPEGNLVLTDLEGAPESEEVGTEVNPVRLEIFNNRFASIAERMGVMLQKTSLSVNVKERLDFSCAIFSPGGDLVVNAPHIPVHLGAMAECVKRVRADLPDLKAGDVIVTNDPFRGGSHIPDVTVVTPVFEEERIVFWTASRAHHAEIGGSRPGSMPPDSKNLGEEGVLLRNFRVVDGGEPRFEALRGVLTAPPWPSRAPDDNIADISAQIAANQSGAAELQAMIRRHGREAVHAYMGYIQAAAETKMRAALGRLPDGEYPFEDALDNGAPIRVRITVRGDEAVVDFAGTGPVLEGNLNANRAIVGSAVLYCLRCLINEDIPLNGGVLAPVRIRVPICFLNPPAHEDASRCAAVVGGNVETSQRIVDVVLGALRVAAASQGTMNNFIFGNDRVSYYETICGGSGSGPGFDGADAVQVHMTNTRLTDPEVLEARFPVRLRRFEIRRGSGGRGRWRGGDGIVREIEFLEAVQGSILSQRRTRAPYGLDGGEPGAKGRNLLNGRELGSVVQFEAEAGDVLRIETPGGGGTGKRESREGRNGS